MRHMRPLCRCLVLTAFALSLLGVGPALGQAHEPDPEAMKAFVDLVSSYRARPALTVKTKLRIEMGQGDLAAAGEEVTAEITYGKELPGGMVKLRGYTCWLGDGKLQAVHDHTDHSYFAMPDDGSPYWAMFNAFIDIPFPHLAILFGDEDIETWVSWQLQPRTPNIRPTSIAPEVDLKGKKVQRLQLTSDYASMSMIIDPATKLLDSAELKITGGDTVQAGTTAIYKYRFEHETYQDAPLDKSMLVFNPSRRQRVDMLATLAPPPAPPAGQMAGPGGGEAQGPGPLVGKPAPPLLLATADGNAVDLEELDGQVVVIDFWATWCGPCRRALPQLHDVRRWADDEGMPVTVITVNVFEGRGPGDSPDKRLAKVKKFWEENDYSLPVAMDYTDEVASAYGVQSIPATFVIRADGVVFAQHSGAGPDYADSLKGEIQGAIEALAAPGD